MFTHKNLMTVCCAAVLAFGLAACGSSSSDDDKVVTTTPVVPGETVDPAPTDDEIAAAAEAATKAAKTKLDAIDDIVATDGLGGATATPITSPGAGSYDLSVTRDRMATTVTVTVNGANADADDDDEMFTQEEDLGGGLTKHTRDGEMGEQEIVMVMTDIAGADGHAVRRRVSAGYQPQYGRPARGSISHGRDRQCGHVEFVQVSFYSRYDAQLSRRRQLYG